MCKEDRDAKTAVVIPAKNESGRIEEVIQSVQPYCDEVLVVDGHSEDATRQIAKRLGARVVLDNSRGKGDGVRTGIKKARGEIIVFIDGDGSHEPSDIPRLLQPIIDGEADMVVGSRSLGGSDELRMDFENLIRQSGIQGCTLKNVSYDTMVEELYKKVENAS